MKEKKLFEEIEIPENVEVSLNNNILKIKGPKGEIQKNFTPLKVELTKENNNLKFSVHGLSRKSKDYLNSGVSIFDNMAKGVKDNFTYKLKICSGHFPMSVSVEKNKVIIKNFLGEKVPRTANIIENVNVKVNGDIIVVESLDKEKAGQVSANIEIATKIRKKDRRVFQDGCFIIEKAGENLK
ncbi:MAG: 50S ribosomal protein L6 [Nanoarchaeota archaeon]